MKNINMVYNSRRPANMIKENHHLMPLSKKPKFSTGPTAPNPGPIFPIMARAAVKDEIKSMPLRVATAVVITVRKK